MDAFTERIKQYPAKEQAELRVRVMLPGNMFPGLTLSEQRAKYEAEANGYELAHTFPKKLGVRAKPITCEGIRYLCVSDVMDDPEHQGFIIPIADWNRHRHDTYKDNREAEKIYIRRVAQAPTECKPIDSDEPERPPIYNEFEFVSSGKHTRKKTKDSEAKEVSCEFWKCKNTSGNCKATDPFKVVQKATGKMFGHLKKCNPSAWTKVKLQSAGSDIERGENGEVRAPPPPPPPPPPLCCCRSLLRPFVHRSSNCSPSPRCCHPMLSSPK